MYANGSGIASEVGAIGDVEITSVVGEDSADESDVEEVVDETFDVDVSKMVVCSTSVPVSMGSGLFGSPLQSTRYG